MHAELLQTRSIIIRTYRVNSIVSFDIVKTDNDRKLSENSIELVEAPLVI